MQTYSTREHIYKHTHKHSPKYTYANKDTHTTTQRIQIHKHKHTYKNTTHTHTRTSKHTITPTETRIYNMHTQIRTHTHTNNHTRKHTPVTTSDDNKNQAFTSPKIKIKFTISGAQSDSHIPYIWSVQVPAMAKSLATIGQPMRSRAAMYGSPLDRFRPAITGSTKYGPNLRRANKFW